MINAETIGGFFQSIIKARNSETTERIGKNENREFEKELNSAYLAEETETTDLSQLAAVTLDAQNIPDLKLEAFNEIEEIIALIAEMLNINVGEQIPQFEFETDATGAQLADLSQESIWHLSQLLAVIEEMGDAFLQAGFDNETGKFVPGVEFNGQILLPEEAIVIGQNILHEVSKLEEAFEKLGISQKVAENFIYDDFDIESETEVAQQKDITEVLKNPEAKTNETPQKIQNIVERFTEIINKTEANAAKEDSSPKEPVIEALEELKKGVSKDALITEKTPQNVETAKEAVLKEAIKEEIKAEAKNKAEADTKTEVKVTKATVTQVNADGKTEVKTETVISEVKGAKVIKEEKSVKSEGVPIKQNTDAPLSSEKEAFTPIRDAMLKNNEAMSTTASMTVSETASETKSVTESPLSMRFVRIFEREIIEQVQRTVLNSISRNGVHQVSLTLSPEKLGEIKLDIRVDGNTVSAQLNVENAQVKQIIEQNIQVLRDSLAQHNLSASSLDVNINGHEDPRQAFEKMGRRAQKNAGRKETVTAELETVGADTGRRFGTNSFEIYI